MRTHRSWIYKPLARYREGGLEGARAAPRRPRSSLRRRDGSSVDPQAAAASERWATPARHDRGAPGGEPRRFRCLDDLAGTRATGSSPSAAEAPAPLRTAKRPAERDVAGRRHSLEAVPTVDGRDPQPDRRPLPVVPRLWTPTPESKPQTSFRASTKPPSHGLPTRCSQTTALSSPAPTAGQVLLSPIERLGVLFKNHALPPRPAGRFRLHQTLSATSQATTSTGPRSSKPSDAFAHYYNDIRPHRAPGGRTPLQAHSVASRPSRRPSHDHFGGAGQGRQDRNSLRYDSKLYKIGWTSPQVASSTPHRRPTVRVDTAAFRTHARPQPYLPAHHSS